MQAAIFYGGKDIRLNRTSLPPHATVAVLGTGAIGMTLGQVAKAYGVGRVLMVGTRAAPLALATAAGAADVGVPHESGDAVATVLEYTGGEGVDAVFETVGGTASTLNQAIAMARRGGTVSILGLFTQSQDIDAPTAYRKELRLQWSNSFSRWQGVPEYQIALNLLSAGRLRAEPLVTTHFPLDRIHDAFAAAEDKRRSGAVKVMVHP